MANIKTIHSTSVGSIVGTAFSLKIDFNILQDYLIKCLWDKFSKKNRNSILENLWYMPVKDKCFSNCKLFEDSVNNVFCKFVELVNALWISSDDFSNNITSPSNITEHFDSSIILITNRCLEIEIRYEKYQCLWTLFVVLC